MDTQDLKPQTTPEAKPEQPVDVQALVNELSALREEINKLKVTPDEQAKTYNAYEQAKMATEAEQIARQNEEYLTTIAEENVQIHNTLSNMGGVYAKLAEKVKNEGYKGLSANKELKFGFLNAIISDPLYRKEVPTVHVPDIVKFNSFSPAEQKENINYFFEKIVPVTIENHEKTKQTLLRQKGENKVVADSYTAKFLSNRAKFPYWQNNI